MKGAKDKALAQKHILKHIYLGFFYQTQASNLSCHVSDNTAKYHVAAANKHNTIPSSINVYMNTCGQGKSFVY